MRLLESVCRKDCSEVLVLPLVEPKALSKSCSSVASAALLEDDEAGELLLVADVSEFEAESSCDVVSLPDEPDSLLAEVDAPSACARAARASARLLMPPDDALPTGLVCADEVDEPVCPFCWRLCMAWNSAPINCCMAGSLLLLVGALGLVVLVLASVLSGVEAVLAVLLESVEGVMPSCESVCSSAVIRGLVEPEEDVLLEDCCSASCRKERSELEFVCWVPVTP